MRLLINGFIIIHLLLILIWLFPIYPQVLAVEGLFNRYMVFLGLDQNYWMFAPSVRKTNRHLMALITFHDLSTVIWSCPRMERLGIMEAMQKERYRKFANDNIVASFKMFLPDFSRYIARLYGCRDNQPELVSIYLCETDIPKPETISYSVANDGAGQAKEPAACRLANIFTYQVEAQDLQRH